MITLSDALGLIRSHAPVAKIKKIKTADALGAVVAKDIYSPINLPLFDNSAVDGFAINTASLTLNKPHPVTATLYAEAINLGVSRTGAIARVMTGAPIPAGMDAVVMKENTSDAGAGADADAGANTNTDHVCIKVAPRVGANIRYAGEDISGGDLVVGAGTTVCAQHIGVCLGVSLAELAVYQMPRVKIICTGDELVPAPNKLKFGQVYFLVGPMLKAQCKAMGINDVSVELVGDSQKNISQAIERSLDHDLVLITGGMSKGDRDFVRPALNDCGVKQVFYRGMWRPGKPLLFGKKDQTCVFGLPGNPVAVFVGWHIFVRELIYASMGLSAKLKPLTARLVNSFDKPPGYAFFARAIVNENNELTILPHQGSHQMLALSQANALCYLTPEQAVVQQNQIVHYYPI